MKIAIYPGTFDPVTNGHLDIINRSLKIFDKVIVAVTDNDSKNPYFSVRERIEMLSEVTKGLNVEVEGFDGLLVDYIKRKKSKVIIRALRAVSDFDYEFQMAVINKELSSEIETIFLMTNKEYFYLSSSIVKELAKSKADISKFVPKAVEKRLKNLEKKY